MLMVLDITQLYMHVTQELSDQNLGFVTDSIFVQALQSPRDMRFNLHDEFAGNSASDFITEAQANMGLTEEQIEDLASVIYYITDCVEEEIAQQGFEVYAPYYCLHHLTTQALVLKLPDTPI